MTRKFKRLGGPTIIPVLSPNIIEKGQVVKVPEMLSSGLWADKVGWQEIIEPAKPIAKEETPRESKPKGGKEAVKNG